MTYKEACQYLNLEPRLSLTGGNPAVKPMWEPKVTSAPGNLWQQKARRLVDESIYHLWSPSGKTGLKFLNENKGLAKETIKKFSLGCLLKDSWDAAPAWGLAEVLKDNGKPKRFWLPKGIIIPLCQGKQVLRVRIRRPEGEPRYFVLRGSSTRAMILGGSDVTILVESELDAMLLYQEASELAILIALGNAQARPDREAADLLKKNRLILVSLDADKAGATESWRWWKAHFSQAQRWPPIQGKDPGDMFAAGVNLKAWVQAGLAEYGK